MNSDESQAAAHLPGRLQLSRRRGWKKPENTVLISRPHRWGNPFKVEAGRTQAEAAEAFRAWLADKPEGGPHP